MTRQPDDAAFRRFAGECAPGLFRTAHLLTGDWHLAEDLVQDTLARGFLSHRRRRSATERPAAELPEGNADRGHVGAGFVYDDGQGRAEVGVSLEYPLPGGAIASPCDEWNASDGKGATVTRDDPPFTVAEVVAIAAAPDYAEQISRSRAKAAESLFVPDPDPGAPPTSANSAPAAPSYCG